MVIAAVDDCGSCTKFLIYNTIFAEDHGKSAVALVHKGFMNDARATAAIRGMPGLRVVAESVPPESTVMKHIEGWVDEAMPPIVAALSQPLSPEEQNPQRVFEPVPRVALTGTLDEVNRYFYEQGWTDGLPIIPPTEAKVAEMLQGTDLPRDDVIGKLIPRQGKVTVEKVAINAVMAVALPKYGSIKPKYLDECAGSCGF